MCSADDRAVQDLECKSALMHFGSEQLADMSGRTSRHAMLTRRMNPRVARVRSLAKPPSCNLFYIRATFADVFSLPHCFKFQHLQYLFVFVI